MRNDLRSANSQTLFYINTRHGEEVRSAEPFFAVLGALGRTDRFRAHEVPRIKAVLETLKVF